MINNILLVVFTLCIPVILFVSLFLYKKDNLEKVNKVIIIVTLALELIRFFYNASFYDKAKTPSGELTFSFITFFIVFGLFASFNKGKLGIFFKRITSYTFLIPMFFAIFAPRVYLALAKDDAGNTKTLVLTVNVLTPTYSAWMTESELNAAGHTTTEYGIDSKPQYRSKTFDKYTTSSGPIDETSVLAKIYYQDIKLIKVIVKLIIKI